MAKPDLIRTNHTVILVRHGETALNAKGRFQGGLDEPLNATGENQARELAARLKNKLEPELLSALSLRSSPLKRAVMTTEILAAELGKSFENNQITDELTEMRFGRWQGLTSSEVKEKYPQERKRRKADRWHFAPSGGQSFRDLVDPVTDWIQSVDQPVLAVTHFGVIRVAAVVAGGFEIDHAMALKPAHGDIWKIHDGTLERL
ncbi:MAG: histidine phosphatase family protein [Rhizobiaceae bacterium]